MGKGKKWSQYENEHLEGKRRGKKPPSNIKSSTSSYMHKLGEL